SQSPGPDPNQKLVLAGPPQANQRVVVRTNGAHVATGSTPTWTVLQQAQRPVAQQVIHDPQVQQQIRAHSIRATARLNRGAARLNGQPAVSRLNGPRVHVTVPQGHVVSPQLQQTLRSPQVQQQLQQHLRLTQPARPRILRQAANSPRQPFQGQIVQQIQLVQQDQQQTDQQQLLSQQQTPRTDAAVQQQQFVQQQQLQHLQQSAGSQPGSPQRVVVRTFNQH
ncbi:hypothetical protein BIW11_07555, partial [Tropilaelaps mercedesae]